MGLVTAKWMIRNFKYAVLAVFVIAAVITPTPGPHQPEPRGGADAHPLRIEHPDRADRRPRQGEGPAGGRSRTGGLSDGTRERESAGHGRTSDHPQRARRNGPQKLVSENPATLEPVGEVSLASPELCQRAIQAAKDAYPVWRWLDHREKRAIFKRAENILARRASEAGRLIAMEKGSPYAESLAVEVFGALQSLNYYGHNQGRLLRSRRAGPSHAPLPQQVGDLPFPSRSARRSSSRPGTSPSSSPSATPSAP